MMEAAKEFATFQRNVSRKASEELESQLVAEDLKITQPSPEAMAATVHNASPPSS